MRATFCFQASFLALLFSSSCCASGVRDTPLARLSEIGAEDEIDWQFFSRFKGGAWRREEQNALQAGAAPPAQQSKNHKQTKSWLGMIVMHAY